MKRILYCPIDVDIQKKDYENYKYDMMISFSKQEYGGNIFIPDVLLQKAKLNFILEFCLAIAICEAYEGDELLFPIDNMIDSEDILNKNQFFCCLQLLAQEATLRKIKVNFLHEFSFDFKNKKEKENYTISSKDTPLLVFSGGLDCTVASYYLTNQGANPSYMFFEYGQNNIAEERYCVNKQIINRDIGNDKIILEKTLKDFYDNIKSSVDMLNHKKITIEDKEAEYVPFRNSIFIGLALSYCIDGELNCIVTGSQLDDRISPDNSAMFYFIYNTLIKSYKKTSNIRIVPVLFSFGGKKEVVKLGMDLNVDFKYVWTCHNPSQSKDKMVQCGECSDCLARKKAFEKNGLVDPIPYQEARSGE